MKKLFAYLASLRLAVILLVLFGSLVLQVLWRPFLSTGEYGAIVKDTVGITFRKYHLDKKIKDVAQANGLHRFHDDWLLQGPGVERVIITPPTLANPTVCQMTLNYEIGQTDGVVGVLANWSAAQNPPLQPLSVAYAAGPNVTGWNKPAVFPVLVSKFAF